MRRIVLVFVAIAVVINGAVAFAQFARVFIPLEDDPTINYSGPTQDPVAILNRNIEAGKVELEFSGELGYLRFVLEALDVPVG